MNNPCTNTNLFFRFQQSIKNNPFSALLFFALVLFFITSFKSAESAIDSKVGVVNLDYVVANSTAGKNLQTNLEAFQKQVQQKGDQLSQEARNIRQQIANGTNTMSDEQLSGLQKAYEDKTIEIRRFRDDKQREGEKMKNEGLQEIEKQLGPLVNTLAQQQGIDILLNNTPGVVLWSNKTIDLTQSLIELLNK